MGWCYIVARQARHVIDSLVSDPLSDLLFIMRDCISVTLYALSHTVSRKQSQNAGL